MSKLNIGKIVDVTLYVFLAVSIIGALFNKQIFEFIENQQNNSKVEVLSQDEASKIKIGGDSKELISNSNTPATSTPSSLGAQISNNKPVNKPYVAGVCTKTPIPKDTDTEYVNYLYEDEEKLSPISGYDGYLETCTADSNGFKIPDYRREPFNDLLYVGTKKRPTSTPSSGYTYAEAYQLATNNCGVLGTANTGAFTQCVDAYMRQYGF